MVLRSEVTGVIGPLSSVNETLNQVIADPCLKMWYSVFTSFVHFQQLLKHADDALLLVAGHQDSCSSSVVAYAAWLAVSFVQTPRAPGKSHVEVGKGRPSSKRTRSR